MKLTTQQKELLDLFMVQSEDRFEVYENEKVVAKRLERKGYIKLDVIKDTTVAKVEKPAIKVVISLYGVGQNIDKTLAEYYASTMLAECFKYPGRAEVEIV